MAFSEYMGVEMVQKWIWPRFLKSWSFLHSFLGVFVKTWSFLITFPERKGALRMGAFIILLTVLFLVRGSAVVGQFIVFAKVIQNA